MGVYSLKSVYESSVNIDAVEPEYIFEENYMEAALRHTYENNCNLNNILQVLGIMELADYEENGQELLYEAGNVKGFFAKIKAGLMKIWQKIKSLFTKFFAKMQSFGKDDKAFITKYKKEILNGETKDLKYKGYNFTIDDPKMKAEQIYNRFANGSNDEISIAFVYGGKDVTIDDEEVKTIFPTEVSDILEKARGIAINKNETLDQSEFSKELFKLFRNDEDSKQELDEKDDALQVNMLINFLMGSSKEKKEIEDDFRKFEKQIKELIRELDKKENALYKDNNKDNTESNGKKVAIVTRANKIVNGCLSIMEQVESAKMQAFNDKRKQCKAICVKLIGRKAKNESYEYDGYGYDESFTSFLDDVKLV